MSYTILHQSGDTCVKDNVTGLIWEQKTDDGGLRHNNNAYTLYSTDSSTNGGEAGTKQRSICKDSNSQCDISAFVKAVNATNYCGYSDWRLPSISELHSLSDYSRFNPAISIDYFPNTESGTGRGYGYVTSESEAQYVGGVLIINHMFGNPSSTDKYGANYIRLVHSEN